MHTSSSGSRRGFTVIEMVIVMVIVFILAAILYPVFRRGRESDHGPGCPINLKQMALGFMQYIQDYDDCYPPEYIDPDGGFWNSGNDRGWTEIIQPYSKNTKIFQCPQETTPPHSAGTTGNAADGYTDYWYNTRLGRGTQAGIKKSSIRFLASVVLNGDGAGGKQPSNYGAVSPTANDNPAYPELARHREGNFYSFCDGHVKWYQPGMVRGFLTGCSALNKNKPDGHNATFCTG